MKLQYTAGLQLTSSLPAPTAAYSFENALAWLVSSQIYKEKNIIHIVHYWVGLPGYLGDICFHSSEYVSTQHSPCEPSGYSPAKVQGEPKQ